MNRIIKNQPEKTNLDKIINIKRTENVNNKNICDIFTKHYLNFLNLIT